MPLKLEILWMPMDSKCRCCTLPLRLGMMDQARMGKFRDTCDAKTGSYIHGVVTIVLRWNL